MWLAEEYDNLQAVLDWALRSGRAELGLRLAVALERFWEMRAEWSEVGRWLNILLASGAAGGFVSTQLRARALNTAGLFARIQGDIGQAEALFRQALSLYESLHDKQGRAISLGYLGSAAQMRGDLEPAEALYEQSLALYQELGRLYGAAADKIVKAGMAFALSNMGALALMRGRYGRARDFLEQGIELYRDL